MSDKHPLYLLSVPRSEVERMLSLFDMPNGSALIFPGTCWADYLSFIESGEMPLGLKLIEYADNWIGIEK